MENEKTFSDMLDMLAEGKTLVDEYAYTMAEALSNYCKKHDQQCTGCVFLRKNEKRSFDGIECLLYRASPDQWFEVE